MIVGNDHPDYEMEIYMMKGEKGHLYIIQDRPFQSGEVSWLEYDTETGYINFIMDDGELRDFGMPIDQNFAPNLKDYNELIIALVQNSLYVDGAKYPLIVHGGN